MQFFTVFLITSVFFGPGMAIYFGLDNPNFNPTANLPMLLIVETVAIILVYIGLSKLPKSTRFKHRLMKKATSTVRNGRQDIEKKLQNASENFKGTFGELGFYMALALISFAYGVYISAVVAYFMNVEIKRAVASIAVGGAIAIVFWWYLAIGVIPFVTPPLVFAVTMGLTILLIVYGVLKIKLARRGNAADK